MHNALRAVPAQFDRSKQYRKSMIAKTHVARKQLGMVDDDYRALLFDKTGHLHTEDCSDQQLSVMLDALKAKGFRPLPSKTKSRRVAMHPMARKARIMWQSLYHLGVVHNPGEPALEAFARRQLKCAHFAWANQSEAAKLIEALKDMAKRNGWTQTDHKGHALGPLGLNDRLCHAILQRLKDAKAIPADWSLDIAAHRLLGINTRNDAPFTIEQHQQLAAGLGERLREAGVLPGDSKGERP